MQTALFPSRVDPYTGFPNPKLIPARARNYVQLQGTFFRRDGLSIGQSTERWWATQPHAILFEITEREKERIPVFTAQADMEAYVIRLVAFEARTLVPFSQGEGTHGAGSDNTN